jgi:hypothetical protein
MSIFFLLTFLTYSNQTGTAALELKIMMALQMSADFVHKTAVQMNHFSTIAAFDMKMLFTAITFPYILKSGTFAFIRSVFQNLMFFLKFIQKTVNRCYVYINPLRLHVLVDISHVKCMVSVVFHICKHHIPVFGPVTGHSGHGFISLSDVVSIVCFYIFYDKPSVY